MKKILITGANGLLGQKLVSLLSQQQDVNLLATAKGICRFSCRISQVNGPRSGKIFEVYAFFLIGFLKWRKDYVATWGGGGKLFPGLSGNYCYFLDNSMFWP